MIGRVFIALVALSSALLAEQPAFYRAVNLNGSAIVIDGQQWEGREAANFSAKGSTFENQAVPLIPPTDAPRAQMLRSSVWGSVELRFTNVPASEYQVFLYVWEDNHNERFDILLNDQIVLEGFQSGSAGMWKKLGPWPVTSDGSIKLNARGGAANLSGIEIWKGAGRVPVFGEIPFVTELTAEQTEFFEKRIRPVLANNCYECHSAQAAELKGELLLDSRLGIAKGGHTGPAVIPGAPDRSLLIAAVKHSHPDLKMPPKKKLGAEEISDLEKWVKMGAPDPRTVDTVAAARAKSAIDWNKAREFWSFRPLQKPTLPSVQNAQWPLNEIDHFILARIEAAKLTPSAPAERRVLIRRATYDLTGLPPTPEEVEAFVNDPYPNAFATVVDRLLASERYGERWGRHWLDVVRYADTAGDNSDFPIPQHYRYRNWVIDAFNRDMPYDKFVRLQIAGDLIPGQDKNETQENLIATGYLANARRFGSRVSDYPQHLTIEDTIDNLGRAFLGLTVSCARCHNHKFDPITNEDYYALYGIFHSTRYPWPGIELEQKQRDLVPLVPASEFESAKDAHRNKQKALDAQVTELESKLKAAEGDAKKSLEGELQTAKKAADKHKRAMLPVDMAYAVGDAARIEDVPLQIKGDPAKPGPLVRRGFLKVINGAEVPAHEKASGRLHLANWLVSEDNPLAARVMANRIWLYHFGRGLTPTPNDFGKQGKPPTHPELLDFLATRFVDSGWSIKAMHRQIMLSQTYQMGSQPGSEALAIDPNNELLTAFPRRRMDAESIRDTLLALGGNLDLSRGGAHPFPEQSDWNFTQHNPFKAVYETNKRSVYVMTQRIARHPFFAIFDGADPAASTAMRLTSTTPVQSLFLLNDPFVHEQARRFATRIMAQEPDDPARFGAAVQLALARRADSAEVDQAMDLLAKIQTQLKTSGVSDAEVPLESWQAMARALFRLNEFVYLD